MSMKDPSPSKYIKEYSITYGFNPECGQNFFDCINDTRYRKYVHSYYFSIDRNRKSDLYKDLGIDVLKILESCNTYDIPGNLLFNAYGDGCWVDQSKLDKIKQCMSISKLDAVTILKPEDAYLIKEQFPELKVHLSVRYFDELNDIKNKIDRLFSGDFMDHIDVVNISGVKSYNDHKLIKEIHNRNAQVKFIVDEGCVLNRHLNYCSLPGCEDFRCHYKDPSMDCRGVIDKYNWMSLATSIIYKEQLEYYDIDILKIASRDYSLECVQDSLEYWTSNKHTNRIDENFGQYTSKLDIKTNYNEFLEYCKFKSLECTGYCQNCRMCEKYFNKMLKDYHKQ